MSNYMTICESEIEDYKTVLGQYGCLEMDFTLEEKLVEEYQNSFGSHQSGIVTVIHVKSGKEKSYHTGHKTHWVLVTKLIGLQILKMI